jgi:hypothetical protein
MPRGAAFDAETMAGVLQDEMVGHQDRRRIVHCVPGRAQATAAEGYRLRYQLEIVEPSGQTLVTTVTAHVLATQGARRLLGDRLRRLGLKARGRPELRVFERPVASFDALDMVACAYPIDADLPTLIEATDPAVAAALLGTAPDQCAVSLVRYGRGSRCLLRYDAGSLVVLGKVSDDDRGARAERVLRSLSSERVGAVPAPSFEVPRVVGYHPALRLLLLEWTPGEPRLSQLFRLYARGGGPPVADVEDTVESYGAIAAELHASRVTAERPRPAGAELARIAAEIAAVRRTAPDLAHWLERMLVAAEERTRRSRVLRAALCHGDLKHNQVLDDGARRTLVDFDTVCDAEPALDLGHFLGYLRLKVSNDAADGLCDRFLAGYVDAAGTRPGMQGLRERVAVYEVLSLLGRAVHSYQKFKPERLTAIRALLEERVACSAT